MRLIVILIFFMQFFTVSSCHSSPKIEIGLDEASTYKDTIVTIGADEYKVSYTLNKLNTTVKHISSLGEEIFEDNSVHMQINKEAENILDTILVKQNYLRFCSSEFLQVTHIQNIAFEYVKDNILVFELSLCEPETDNCLFFNLLYNTKKYTLETEVLDY